MKSSGFILFSVLLIMQICMLFTIYELSSAIYAAKSIADEKNMDGLMHHAEGALKQTEMQIMEGVLDCKMPVTSSWALSKLSVFWWKSNACIGNFQKMQYYYVVESLGVDHCRKNVPRFNRISVMMVNQDLKTRVLLQSVVAVSTEQKLTCKMPMAAVYGRRLWRKWIRREEDDD